MKPTDRYGREQARRSLLHTARYRAISQAATMISYVVLVRGLSEQSFGVLNILYSFIPIISVVASLGLEQTLKRFQPEYLRAGDTVAAAWLVRVVTGARLVANIALILIVLLAWNYIAPWFKISAYRVDFALFSVLLLLLFQARILQLSFASHMLHQYSVGSTAVLSIAKLAIYLVLFVSHAFTLRTAILADTVAYGLAYANLSLAHRRLCRPAAPIGGYRPAAAEKKRLLRYGAYNNFNDAGALLTHVQMDNFFVAALLNPLAVGAYAFYVRLSQMAAQLVPIRLFENVVQPLFFSIPPHQVDVRVPRYFTLLLDINLLFQLPLIAYVTVYHREIVQVVFAGKFADSSVLLPLVVAFSTTSNVLAIPVTLVAQHAEKASLILFSQLAALYQIAAMFALIPVLGVYGAAIATGTFHLFRNLFVWWNVRDVARWLNAGPVLVASLTIWGLAIGLCYGLKLLMHAPPIVNAACGAIICGIASLLYVRSPTLSHSDREILANVLHGREARILRWLGLGPAKSAVRSEQP